MDTRSSPLPIHRRRLVAALLAAGLILAGGAGVAAQTPSGAPAASATSGGPPGAPPGGGPPGAPPGGAPPGDAGSTGLDSTATGALTQSGGTTSKRGETYTATVTDESGVLVTDGGSLTLTDATVTTSGDTSSDENSSFYGLNAGVLATGDSAITMSGGTISTTGTGANGAFASGAGSSVTLSGVSITARGDGGHGVMATQGGSVALTDVSMDTSGAHAAPIATDRGGGTIVATGGQYLSSGTDSPGIYSTGDISVTGGAFESTGSELAVIEGANTITLVDSSLTSSKADKWGVMFYQSMSGDAEGTQGTFTMTGGSLANIATTGPLFYVTNSTGVITLTGVDIDAASGVLVRAAAGGWGTSGSNGGSVVLTADSETLTGDLVTDDISSMAVTLRNGTTLTGAIDTATLTLDASSSWVVTADSALSSVADTTGLSGTSITSITGNGHTVTYDATLAANDWLGGATYDLAGGGALTPAT